jgi:hypothetical protein
MRESSPNNLSATNPKTASQTEGKSLFRNILAVSLSGSRFYPDPAISPARKLLRMSILDGSKKKIFVISIQPKSPPVPPTNRQTKDATGSNMSISEHPMQERDSP